MNRAGTRLLKVNYNHFLSRGLLDCIIFNQGGQNGLVNLSGPGNPPILGTFTPGGWRSTTDGPGLYVPTDNTAAHSYYALTNQRTATDFSIRIRFIPVSFPNGNSAIFNSAGGDFRCYANTSGNIGFTQVGGAVDGGIHVTGWSPGEICELILVRNNTSGNLNFYVNGALLATTGAMTGANSTGVTQLLGRDNASANQSGNFIFTAFQTWNRLLNASEARQLFNDPECFLVPVSGSLTTDPFLVTIPVQPPPTTLFAQACL
jgi:hypothetical protein